MAIGGERFPCTSFHEHLVRFEATPSCKLLVLLGEVGGTLEYEAMEAVKSGRLRKPQLKGKCAGSFGRWCRRVGASPTGGEEGGHGLGRQVRL